MKPTTTSMKGRKNTDRAADARERILRVAEELFANHGFESTSTTSIASHAGVPSSLIFYHYSSKDGLLQAVLDRNHLSTAIRNLFPENLSNTTSEEALQTALEGLLAWIEEHRAWARLFFQELTSDREGADRMRSQRKEALRHLAGWLERHLVVDGRRFKEAGLAAHLIGGSLMVAALVDRPAHKKAYVRSVLRLLTQGGFEPKEKGT